MVERVIVVVASEVAGGGILEGTLYAIERPLDGPRRCRGRRSVVRICRKALKVEGQDASDWEGGFEVVRNSPWNPPERPERRAGRRSVQDLESTKGVNPMGGVRRVAAESTGLPSYRGPRRERHCPMAMPGWGEPRLDQASSVVAALCRSRTAGPAQICRSESNCPRTEVGIQALRDCPTWGSE